FHTYPKFGLPRRLVQIQLVDAPGRRENVPVVNASSRRVAPHSRQDERQWCNRFIGTVFWFSSCAKVLAPLWRECITRTRLENNVEPESFVRDGGPFM